MMRPLVTRWWLIRHAPVAKEVSKGRLYGRLDLPCDCSNKAAFVALAAQLPKGGVWLRSSLQRTGQTLEALADAGVDASKAPLVIADLDEQDFGDWQGLSWNQLEAQRADEMAAFWRAPATTSPPNGESFGHMVARVGAVFDELTDKHADTDLICVAHAGTVRAALVHVLGLKPEQGLAFGVEPLSLTRLDHLIGGKGTSRSAGWRVIFTNCVVC